jgi:hypothetical protein
MTQGINPDRKTIELELNGKKYTVELNGSETAEAFAQCAPFQSSLSEYAGSHYWGAIPRNLPTPQNLKTSKPLKGSVYYADHLTAIAIYFDDPGSIAPYVVYHLGTVTEDMSALRNAGNRIELKVL